MGKVNMRTITDVHERCCNVQVLPVLLTDVAITKVYVLVRDTVLIQNFCNVKFQMGYTLKKKKTKKVKVNVC